MSRLIEEYSGLNLFGLSFLVLLLMTPISLGAEVKQREDTDQTDIESKVDTAEPTEPEAREDTASEETESDMAESTGEETTTDESDSTNEGNSSTESEDTEGCGCGTTGSNQVPVSWLIGIVLLGFARTYRKTND